MPRAKNKNAKKAAPANRGRPRKDTESPVAASPTHNGQPVAGPTQRRLTGVRLAAQQRQAAVARIAKARHARDAARRAYLDATEALIAVETANGVSDTAMQEFRRSRTFGH